MQDIDQIMQDIGQIMQCIGQVMQDIGQVMQCIGQVMQDIGQVMQDIGQVMQDIGQVMQDIGHSETNSLNEAKVQKGHQECSHSQQPVYKEASLIVNSTLLYITGEQGRGYLILLWTERKSLTLDKDAALSWVVWDLVPHLQQSA